MLKCVLAAATVVACGSAARPSIDATAVAPRTKLEEARSYELGRGVARDYRVAGRIYGELCNGGCGDPIACRRYLDLATNQRGVVIDAFHYANLTNTMCDRSSVIGCATAATLGVRDDSSLAEEKALSRACAAGDIDACDLASGTGVRPSDDERAARDRACDLGLVAACGRLLGDACREDPAWSTLYRYRTRTSMQASTSGLACLERHAAAAAHEPDPERRRDLERMSGKLRAAFARLVANCDAGDPDACWRIPGRAGNPIALCDAGDYDACLSFDMDRGHDEHAERVACEAGLGGVCGKRAVRELGNEWLREVESKLDAERGLPPKPHPTLPTLLGVAEVLRVATAACEHGDEGACAKLHDRRSCSGTR